MSSSKTTIGIIGTVGLPACYGGFETLTQHLVQQLSPEFNFVVYCSGKSYAPDARKPYYKGAKLVYVPLQANGVQSILYDVVSMIHALVFCDILLILGVSGCLFLPIIRLLTNKRIVVNIDGQEWRRAKWGKLASSFLKLSERFAVRFADEVVADNEAICDYVTQEYQAYSTLIEYGANHAHPVSVKTQHTDKFPFLANDYAFKVCRIEPENNVEMILQAFVHNTQLPLVVVGNWQVSAYSRDLKARYSKFRNLYLLEAIYDPDMLNALRSNAKIYVHGHSAGGTNPSLVEAMHLGVPVLAFDVSYNRKTTENKCLYFSDANALAHILATVTEDALQEMRVSLTFTARARYTWQRIANKYIGTFAIAPQAAPAPSPTTTPKPAVILPMPILRRQTA